MRIHYTDIRAEKRMIGDSKISKQIEIIKQLSTKDISDVYISTPEQDKIEGIDLIVQGLGGKQWQIALRTRIYKPYYKPSYLDEISIRYELIDKNGKPLKTELEKIRNGENKTDYFVYSWFDMAGEHVQTVIVDMYKFKEDHYLSTQRIINDDGSKGLAIRINNQWVKKIVKEKKE